MVFSDERRQGIILHWELLLCNFCVRVMHDHVYNPLIYAKIYSIKAEIDYAIWNYSTNIIRIIYWTSSIIFHHYYLHDFVGWKSLSYSVSTSYAQWYKIYFLPFILSLSFSLYFTLMLHMFSYQCVMHLMCCCMDSKHETEELFCVCECIGSYINNDKRRNMKWQMDVPNKNNKTYI